MVDYKHSLNFKNQEKNNYKIYKWEFEQKIFLKVKARIFITKKYITDVIDYNIKETLKNKKLLQFYFQFSSYWFPILREKGSKFYANQNQKENKASTYFYKIYYKFICKIHFSFIKIKIIKSQIIPHPKIYKYIIRYST